MSAKIRLALVSEVPSVGIGETTKVADAIQHQINEDFRKHWDVDASIEAHESTATIDGAWPVILGDSQRFTFPSMGLHFAHDGTPFALIKHTEEWSVAASHEVLEMCTDPTGDRVMISRSLDDPDRMVEYLLEVCDPCEATEYGYDIGDVRVSDFYTPHYFDADARAGVTYSFNGSIKQPRQVLPGGYLSWWDSYTNWHWQFRLFSTDQGLRRVDDFDSEHLESRRTEIDRITPSPPPGGSLLPASSNGSAPAGPRDKFGERIEELRSAGARARK